MEQDVYITPDYAIEPMLELLDIPYDATFLEPCKGTGAIYNRINCVQRYYAEISEGIDYLSYKPPTKIDFIVTNPPFSLALDFLVKSLGEADLVVYLLRLNFLGSITRHDFWKSNQPTHLYALSKRPCFVWVCKGHKGAPHGCGNMYAPGSTRICEYCGGKVAPGTDSNDYGWFCWDRTGDILKKSPGIDVL